LSEPSFDAASEVFLAAQPHEPDARQLAGAAGYVEIVERDPDSVTLRAELRRAGYVVLLDRFDPNWHARLDGAEVRVFRANHLFRAVRADPGRHEFRFYYRQRGLRPGLLLSLGTLAALIILFAVDPGRRRAG